MFDASEPLAVNAQKRMVRVRGLSKRYAQGFSTSLAFQNLNLDLPLGAVTILYGPNGSGKTTLLRCLAGIASPTNGTIQWIGGDGRPGGVKYVPEGGRGFHADLSPGENLRWASRLTGADLDMAALVRGLPALDAIASLGTPAKRLSRGQKQILSIAMAILQRPDFILLDEPTNGLDPKSEADVIAFVEAARQDGCGVLIATHNLRLQPIADVTVFMRRGEVVSSRAQGGPAPLTCEIAPASPAAADVARGLGFQPSVRAGRWSLVASPAEIMSALAALGPDGVEDIYVVDSAISAMYLEG